MTAALLLAIAAAMLLIRIGWGGRRMLAVAGWTVIATALFALTMRDGAWGLAIGSVVAIVTALALVGHAGWISPARGYRPARPAVATTLPHRWPDVRFDLARRGAVFLLVVPCAFVAAGWLAFGTQALALRGGVGEADATVLMLFLHPIAWAVLMTAQMTRATATGKIAPLALTALLGTVAWVAA